MDPKPQRLVYGEALVSLGEKNEKIVVLDCDVSSSTQTKHFGARFPERFFNFGISEANMASAAAGLASCGYVPFINTFALFMALKAGDQVRAQIAYTRLNVKMAGGYAGLSDFADGASHQSVEDLAVMRAVPNITVVAPSDITETQMAVRAIADHDGPVFIRLSREAVPQRFGPDHPFELGKGIVVRDGSDLTLVATGPMLHAVLQAAEILAAQGVQARIIDMHTVKPIDAGILEQAARDTGAFVSVEEHNVFGGLGSAVCEAVCERYPVPVERVGIPDRFGESGKYPDILKRAGLDSESIAQRARNALKRKGLQRDVHDRTP